MRGDRALFIQYASTMHPLLLDTPRTVVGPHHAGWGLSPHRRSPCVVIAYLMKTRGWRLLESYKWVKQKRGTMELNAGMSLNPQGDEDPSFGGTAPSTLRDQTVPASVSDPVSAPRSDKCLQGGMSRKRGLHSLSRIRQPPTQPRSPAAQRTRSA